MDKYAKFINNKKAAHVPVQHFKQNALQLIMDNVIRTISLTDFKNIPNDVYKLIKQFIGYYHHNHLFFLLTGQGIYGWEISINQVSYKATNKILANKKFISAGNFQYYYHNNSIYRYANFSIHRSNIFINNNSFQIQYKWEKICKIPWKKYESNRSTITGWTGGKLLLFNNNILICCDGSFEHKDGSSAVCKILSYNINTSTWSSHASKILYSSLIQQINTETVFVIDRSANKLNYLYYPMDGTFKLSNINVCEMGDSSYYAPYNVYNKNQIYYGKQNGFYNFDFTKNELYTLAKSNFKHHNSNKSTLTWFNDNPNTLLIRSMRNCTNNYNYVYITNKDIIKMNSKPKTDIIKKCFFNIDSEVYDIRNNKWNIIDKNLKIQLGPFEWEGFLQKKKVLLLKEKNNSKRKKKLKKNITKYLLFRVYPHFYSF